MIELRRPPARTVDVPDLDEDQRAALQDQSPVVRVIGGPGTGKSLLAVEWIRDRVSRGLAADSCLLLAPTRLGAASARERLTARLAATTRVPLAQTPFALGFAILRAEAALAGEEPPRLLSGPQQDEVLRELLAGHRESGIGPDWPRDLEAALETRGFRTELRDLLMRAVEHGVEAADLSRLGAEHGRPEWVAAGQVLDEYDRVTALSRPGSLDPAWLLTVACDRLDEDPEALDRARERLRLVVVDDAQDLTWPAARLLRTIAHPGMQVVLIGDPDAAVQTFRGGDPRLLWWERWPALAEAPSQLLGTAHGLSHAVLHRGGEVSTRIGVVRSAGHRKRLVPAPGARAGEVTSAVLRTSAQESHHIAALLHSAHARNGLPWSQMAVIARGSARTESLRRTLATAGIPVATSGSALPLRDEPVVRALLQVMRISLEWSLDPHASISVDDVEDLLRSVIGGADALSMRRLRRAMRRREREDGGSRTSDELLVAALGDPALSSLDDPSARPLARLTRAVNAGVQAAHRDAGRWGVGVSGESVLWAIWDALGLATIWKRQAMEAGASGERADRTLDAVVALFHAAARYEDALPAAGPEAFLRSFAGEEVPGDSLVARAPAQDAVALVTPAAAAGRRWDLVCIAGVQEGVWPDLRLRGSLLGSSDLEAIVTGRDRSRRAMSSAVRSDEARLLHVALSRSRDRVVVTAVRNDDDQPSVFVDLLDPLPDADQVRPVTSVTSSPTEVDLVGRLRARAASTDEVERIDAARLLAVLAREGVRGADPDGWWGLAPEPSTRPVVAEGQPVVIRPSGLEGHATCPLKWVLTHHGGSGPLSDSASIGTLIHAIAQEHPEGTRDDLRESLDRRWPDLGLPSSWESDRLRARAEQMVECLSTYTQELSGPWRPVAAEASFEVDVGDGIVLRGAVDRLERDEQGRLRVIDFKTGGTAPKKTEVPTHPQLGAYQVAVEAGAFADHGVRSGGAALVQLGGDRKKAAVQDQPGPSADADLQWAREAVQQMSEAVRGHVFSARPSDMCTMCPVRTSCPAQPEGGWA